VNKISKSKSDGKVYSTNNMMMRYVGMDLHKNYLQIAVVDEKGKLIKNNKIENDIKKIGKFFDQINGFKIKNQNTHTTKVVMESSCVWYDIYEYLTEEKNLNVKLSNPIKTRAIASAKIKTDKLDAVKLANLLRGGYISECYVPDKRIIELRELVRHRCALVRMRTKLKNKIHGILLMKGIKIINHHPFSIGYIEQLKKLNNYRIDTYIRLFSSIDNEIRTISKNIISFTKQNATTKLLMTIPGIGYYSALLVMSEIGNINRFPDSSHLCSYAGLIPSTHSSGGITHYGPITKTGSKYLRWIMIECTRSHVRYNKKSNVTTFYNKLVKNKGSSSKAIVAASCKLLKIVYWVMKEKREYTN
jgi:transposase